MGGTETLDLEATSPWTVMPVCMRLSTWETLSWLVMSSFTAMFTASSSMWSSFKISESPESGPRTEAVFLMKVLCGEPVDLDAAAEEHPALVTALRHALAPSVTARHLLKILAIFQN